MKNEVLRPSIVSDLNGGYGPEIYFDPQPSEMWPIGVWMCGIPEQDHYEGTTPDNAFSAWQSAQNNAFSAWQTARNKAFGLWQAAKNRAISAWQAVQKGSFVSLVDSDIHQCKGLALHVPQFYKDPAFLGWLNNGQAKFTWHQGGEPGEYSDVVVLVDPTLNGEGTDSDMPEEIWNQILTACRKNVSPGGDYHIMVRLINVGPSQQQVGS